MGERGLALLKRCEGCRLEAYQDAIGVWTIGWGHTEDVQPGQKISQHQADVMLQSDLEIYEQGVEKLLWGIPVTEAQFDALVCFAYNVGLANLGRSTLLKRLRGGDAAGAAAEFLKWTRAGGKILPGLVKRRQAESDLFRA